MTYAIVFLISYLIGNINPAILVTKIRRGIDIRDINSKNAGSSNVTMTVGYRWGIFVGLADIFKGFLPVLIIRFIFPEQDGMWFLSGFGIILGHVYPVIYKFRGGKGSATFGGVLFATAPLYAFILLIVYFTILYITDYIAISTLVATIATPIVLYALDYELLSIILMILFAIISFKKHYTNYKRIWNRQEVGIRKFHRHKDEIRVKEKAK